MPNADSIMTSTRVEYHNNSAIEWPRHANISNKRSIGTSLRRTPTRLIHIDSPYEDLPPVRRQAAKRSRRSAVSDRSVGKNASSTGSPTTENGDSSETCLTDNRSRTHVKQYESGTDDMTLAASRQSEPTYIPRSSRSAVQNDDERIFSSPGKTR